MKLRIITAVLAALVLLEAGYIFLGCHPGRYQANRANRAKECAWANPETCPVPRHAVLANDPLMAVTPSQKSGAGLFQPTTSAARINNETAVPTPGGRLQLAVPSHL